LDLGVEPQGVKLIEQRVEQRIELFPNEGVAFLTWGI
jgi:hypothetical protein